jgi:hypothetical protein
VLSQEEVSQLINAAPSPFYRILLMTLYAIGDLLSVTDYAQTTTTSGYDCRGSGLLEQPKYATDFKWLLGDH